MDAVARFRAASEQNDMDTLTQTLAEDAELISPLSGHMVFRGVMICGFSSARCAALSRSCAGIGSLSLAKCVS